jgi:hypothetical protein
MSLNQFFIILKPRLSGDVPELRLYYVKDNLAGIKVCCGFGNIAAGPPILRAKTDPAHRARNATMIPMPE